MTELAHQKCEACRVGAPLLTDEERAELLPDIPGWSVITVDGIEQLQRVFTFKHFVGAQSFTNRVAELAEEEGHHPAILLEWGKVTIRWWTHKIGGLHRNDVVMAAKTSAL